MTEHPTPAVHGRAGQPLRTKVVAMVALLGAAVLVLSGCAAGQRAQTAVEVPVIDGVGADLGPINLRAVTIASPVNGSYTAGGSASLQLYIVNNGAPDQLVSVASAAAKSVSIYANANDAFAIPSSATPTPTPSTSSSAKPSGSSSAASAASTPAPTSSSAAPAVTIKLPSGQTTAIGTATTQPQILLSGLSTALFPAMSIPLTFTFAAAGSVTVQVSVHLATGPVTAPTLPVNHSSAE